MKRVSELWRLNGKYYDYPVSSSDAKVYHHSCMAKQGKTIKVYHQDGTMTIGYMFGEKQFTYSEDELVAHRANYQREQELLHERTKILKELGELPLETLRVIKAIKDELIRA